jgi:DNA-binding XRE family transcriptional regulator
MARLRAKLMNPESAYRALIEQLRFAMVRAGKPCLSTLGKQVGYSKATLSKVFTGKAMPSWVLVCRLGEVFQVPPQVVQEWDTLWTAANMHSRKPATVRGDATMPPVPPVTTDTGTAALTDEAGYKCPTCGSWVVDTTLHTGWHLAIEPNRDPAPPTGPIHGWTPASAEFSLLTTALHDEAV